MEKIIFFPYPPGGDLIYFTQYLAEHETYRYVFPHFLRLHAVILQFSPFPPCFLLFFLILLCFLIFFFYLPFSPFSSLFFLYFFIFFSDHSFFFFPRVGVKIKNIYPCHSSKSFPTFVSVHSKTYCASNTYNIVWHELGKFETTEWEIT